MGYCRPLRCPYCMREQITWDEHFSHVSECRRKEKARRMREDSEKVTKEFLDIMSKRTKR